jgi:hypothetical protein
MTLDSPERLISSWCPERGLPDGNITHCFRKTSKFGAVPSHSPPRAGLWLALLCCGHPTLGRSTASRHGQKPVHTQEHSYPVAHLASLVLQVRRTRCHRPRVREPGQRVSPRRVSRAMAAMRPCLHQEPAQGSRRAAFARDYTAVAPVSSCTAGAQGVSSATDVALALRGAVSRDPAMLTETSVLPPPERAHGQSPAERRLRCAFFVSRPLLPTSSPPAARALLPGGPRGPRPRTGGTASARRARRRP